jgi:hypothetical protein
MKMLRSCSIGLMALHAAKEGEDAATDEFTTELRSLICCTLRMLSN